MTEPIKAHDVEAEAVEFIWGERIPRGMISVVAGQPAQGKGLFAARLAADVSGASGLATNVDPDGGRVLYSAAEDSDGSMTRPRLEAAGADLSNVLLWRFAIPANQQELHTLLTDCRTLAERQEQIVVDGVPTPNPDYCPEPRPVDLLVMDPFAAHLSTGVSRHSDNVRSVLGPLTEVIEKTRTAVVIVEHTLKSAPANGHILSVIGGGHSGLPAASRACFVLGKDPDDEDARVLCAAKFNIGQDPLALRFDVDVDELPIVGEIPLLVPDKELIAFDPIKMFEKKKSTNPAHRPPDKRAAAAEWLTNYLAQAGEPTLSSKVQADAKTYGMASKTLRRAADDMGVVKLPPGGGRNCTWDLPDDVKSLMGLPTGEPEGIPDAPPETETEVEVEVTDDMIADFLGGGE